MWHTKVQLFRKCHSSNRQKWMVASFSISAWFTAKVGFFWTHENAFSYSFHFEANRRSKVLLKMVLGILKAALRLKDGMFLLDNYWKFWTFSTLKRKAFSKNWSTGFWWNVLRLKRQHSYKKLLCQKPMLRQVQWRSTK